MLYGAPYEHETSPEEARIWLKEKQEDIQWQIRLLTDFVGLDDESQLNYELDEIKKSVEKLVKFIDSLDRAEIEEMENINACEPDWDAMPGGHDWVE